MHDNPRGDQVGNPIIANIRGGIQFGLLAKVVVQAGFRDLDEQVNVTGLRLSARVPAADNPGKVGFRERLNAW